MTKDVHCAEESFIWHFFVFLCFFFNFHQMMFEMRKTNLRLRCYQLQDMNNCKKHGHPVRKKKKPLIQMWIFEINHLFILITVCIGLIFEVWNEITLQTHTKNNWNPNYFRNINGNSIIELSFCPEHFFWLWSFQLN